MLIAVDIGNSNIVIGLYDESLKKWTAQWRTETSLQKTAIDYEKILRSFFLEARLSLSSVQNAVLSSVVPVLTPLWTELLERLLERKILLLNAEIYTKLPIKINNPYEIGSDLVANSVAAFQKFKQNCIIVDFGTALTFTTIYDKTIAGVSIAPGLKTAFNALYANTAQLPEVPLELPESVMGKNTSHAMQAGILWGYVGLVEYLLNHTQKELGESCKTIATGGLSSILHPLANVFDVIDKNLTIDGLRIIHEINQ